MKSNLKRFGALALALMMLMSLLPMSVFAAGPYCGEGNHTPDLTTKYPANWNNVSGGYEYDYYLCSVCETKCHSPSATDAQYVGHANKGHTPDTARGLNAADFDPVSGGYEEANYYCVGNEPGSGPCTVRVKADGTVVPFKAGSGSVNPNPEVTPPSGGCAHEADLNRHEQANYHPCTGGVESDFYLCKKCDAPVDADSKELTYKEPSASHDVSGDLIPADPACLDGVREEHYVCAVCQQPINKNGENAAGGPATVNHEKGETSEVVNGLTVYPCKHGCGHLLDENGDIVNPGDSSGCTNHEPDEDGIMDANYTECSGGFKVKYFICKHCGMPCDENGNEANASEPVENHSPGTEKEPANYSPCVGGHKEDFYICAVCYMPLNENGEEVEWFEPVEGGAHTPGAEKEPANWTACSGGIKVDFYHCIGCWEAVDANGNVVTAEQGNGKHTLVKVPAQAATEDESGWREFYECKDCYAAYGDAEGKIEINDDNVYDYYIPRLTKPVISNTIKNPPAGKTEAQVKEDMLQVALKADSAMKPDSAKSVLVDVKLQQKNDNGEWVDVTEENFPEDGVSVPLPYPSGVNKNNYKSFDYVVTHMKHDGSVEVIKNFTLQENGIMATFTSLSPVMITYQEKAVTPTPVPVAEITKETANQVLTPDNSKDGALFVSTANFADFDEVRVDGKKIDSKHYDVAAGSTKVTLKKSYLDTLSFGKHTIEIVSNGVSAKTGFTKTGAAVKVTFDVNGGKTPAPAAVNVTPGTAYGKLPTAKHASMYFAGWYTAKTGGTRVTDTTVVTNGEAHTLYARWSSTPVTGDDVSYVQVAVLSMTLLLSLSALAAVVVYKKRKS